MNNKKNNNKNNDFENFKKRKKDVLKQMGLLTLFTGGYLRFMFFCKFDDFINKYFSIFNYSDNFTDEQYSEIINLINNYIKQLDDFCLKFNINLEGVNND